MSAAEAPEDWTVLGEPTRARIVRMIRDAPEGRALVGHLADELGLRQPTVSHHMKELTSRGILARRPEGRRVWYSIDPRSAARVDALLGDAPPGDGGEGASAQPDLARIVAGLVERYRGTFNRQTIERYVIESRDMLSTTDAATPIGSRSAAFATMRLDALARSRSPRERVPEVLFVCVQNAGRSQLAAGILRRLAGDRVLVRTAGSAPAGAVRTSVVAALDEIGIGVGDEFPKPLTDEAVRAADVVVTMGCGDACPVYPGRRYLDWDLPDPVDRPLDEVRAIRDDIEKRVRELLADLVPA